MAVPELTDPEPPLVGAATQAITPSIPDDKYEVAVPVGVLGGKIYVVLTPD